MGIDARILIKNKGERWSPERIMQESAQMCALFGAEKFFINHDGTIGNKRHAIDQTDTVDDILKDNLCWMEEGDRFYEAMIDQQPTRQVYTQDGEPIYGEADEQLLEVHVWTRYYGPGYERGDWLFLRALFAYFNNKDDANYEVWYGGDSSGVEAECMTPSKIAEYDRHFFSKDGRAYYGSFDIKGDAKQAR